MDDIVNPLLLKVKKASPMYPGTGCKYRRGLRVPGCPHHQQADQHRGCSQTREEACVHCVQQSDGDLYTLILAAAAYSAAPLGNLPL